MILTILIGALVGGYCLIMAAWVGGTIVAAVREGIRRVRGGVPLVSKESFNGAGNML